MKKYILLMMLAAGIYSAQAQTTLFFEDFEGGIPGPQAWSTFANLGTLVWSTAPGGGDEAGNWTSPPGSGLAASASSDVFGVAAYDTELISPVIPIPSGSTNITLDFVVNYQAVGVPPTNDDFDVDVSTNGGATWNLVNAFINDTPIGGLRSGPGVPVSYNLDGFVDPGDNMMLRFHYYNPSSTAFDWYAQIDDVEVTATVTAIPTMSEWGLIFFGLLLCSIAIVGIYHKKEAVNLA